MSSKKKHVVSVRVNLHGHSPESDGLSSIREIVEASGRSKIHFLGLADHNTTSGIPSLYREVSSYNREHEHQIQAVSGIEINFSDSGDIIFSKPGPIDHSFLAWAEGVAGKRKTYPTVRAINEAVRKFGAIVTIAHPDCPLAGSISRNRVREIVKKLSPRVRSHVALEVRNYATQVFSIVSIAREELLDDLANELGLATVGFSDFHHAWMIKKQVSTFDAMTVSPGTLKKSIRLGHIKPGYRESLGLFEWMKLVIIVFRAMLRYKWKYHYANISLPWSEPSFAK